MSTFAQSAWASLWPCPVAGSTARHYAAQERADRRNSEARALAERMMEPGGSFDVLEPARLEEALTENRDWAAMSFALQTRQDKELGDIITAICKNYWRESAVIAALEAME
jgi:hypothetical protein